MKFISQTWGGYLQLFSLKLSFIYIPWILAAVTLGPVDGMFVACLSDLIGILVLPTTGTIIPLMTLSNTLFPLFVWLAVVAATVVLIVLRNTGKFDIVKILKRKGKEV